MVGCYIAVFFRKRMSRYLRQKSLAPCKVKVGARGTAGNKGAVCIRFEIGDQSIMLINCHLASGREKDKERMNQMATIFKSAFAKNLRNRGMTVEKHSQVILLGDLNFRIGMLSREEVIEKCKQKQIAELLCQDTLVLAFDKYHSTTVQPSDTGFFTEMLFRSFQEGHIDFMPTYKYDLHSASFDTSKKQRVPAFCDRILWKRNENLQQLAYKCVDTVAFSDHRPVVSHFKLRILDEKKAKKLQQLPQPVPKPVR
mmetsp:Transcript_16961/g.26122  ORF Transcript_16961/g.26122 Transcript_16961/m.26122 type:complete len:255 (-) Transcript_16961:149-913(-)